MQLKIGEIVDSRYRVNETLGEGGMAVVYNATDLKKKKEVAIKFLKAGITSSHIEDKIRFRKEVEVVSRFNHQNIVKIYGVGEYKDIPYIVMELLEGESLYRILNREKIFRIKDAIKIVKQVAEALRYVHSRGIIHRDLKPDNIMIDRKSGDIKLLDFGLALVMELSEIKEEEAIIGTFGYMSPEATGIVNKPVDERSDLYSLGIIFYRLLTGELPFKGKRVSEILHQQVAVIPIRPAKLNSSIPKVIDDIIMKLLEKEPDLRYQSAAGLIYDLEKFEKGEETFVIGEKDQKIKLSYRVRLIGRQNEFNKIIELFDRARDGYGSVCLISGEAGVGKSRLVEEIRGYVYENKGVFFNGKCFDQENKRPYQPFKDILDKYIRRIKHLSTEEMEEEINRVKQELSGEIGEVVRLNPNIIEILGEIPELVKLDSDEKETIRFRMACAKFFCTLSEQVVVLFIDDLQWADEGSLDLFEEILKIVDKRKVLVLGTYRDDEVKQSHRLNRIKQKAIEGKYPLITINLKLFNYGRMRQLVSSILGEREEKAENLTRYIMGRTKGNPFFAITLLRELVEKNALIWKDGYWKEDWEKIEGLKVSENIIDMLLLRIKDLPKKEEQLLKIGSIIGKEFEVDLLYDLINEKKEKIIELIDDAIERQLLEKSERRSKLAFVHDRIKEAFYKKIKKEEKAKYHLKIGEIIEKKNKGKEEEVIFALAHHFIEGGDEEKSLTYALPAAEKAKENYANREAINYYKYVKESLIKRKEKDKRYIQVLEGLGDVLRLEGLYDEALENFKEVSLLVKDVLHKARIFQKIGDTLFQMGKTYESISVLKQTLKILKLKPIPETKIGTYLGFARETVKQIFHRLFPFIFINSKYKNNEKMKIGIKIYIRLGYCYYFIDIIKSGFLVLLSVNISDKMADTYEYIIRIYLSTLCNALGLFSIGEKYIQEGLKTALKLKNKMMEGFAYSYFCLAYFISNKLDKAIENGKKAINILLSLGERWDIALAYAFICFSCYVKGNIFLMKKTAEEFVRLMRDVKDFRTLGWALNHLSKVIIITRGADNEVLNMLNQAIEYEKEARDYPNVAMAYTTLALAFLKDGNYKEAIEKGEKGIDIFINCITKGFWTCDIFGITADAYLTKLEEENISGKEKERYLKRAKFLCNLALKWGKTYKVYWGLALKVTGKYYWLNGRKRKAIKYFERAIKFLEMNNHKYELALTYYEFGKYLFKEGYSKVYNYEKGRELLLNAKEIFSAMDDIPDLRRVNRLFGKEEDIFTEETPRERLKIEREITTVLDTITYISSILDLNNLLEKIIDKAMELTGAERGILFLYPEEEDKEERILKPYVVRNVKKEEISSEAFETSRGIIERVEKDKKSLIVEDAALDEELKNEVSVVKYGLRSVLCVPIMLRNEMLGIIYLDNRLVSGLFVEEDLKILEAIGKQAGISIENAKLYRKAITDGLTKLYNHTFFENYLMKSVSQSNRYNKKLSLLMIDIDRFKKVNDRYGHRAGDLVLKNVAEIMEKNVRRSDLVARYGGEEFVVVLPETDIDGAKVLAEKLRKAIEENRVVCKIGGKEQKIKVTVSIGVAKLTRGDDRIKLIEKVDKALYKAKAAGRNCVGVWK